jgi:SAM-dependent methyltransferase
MASDAIAGARDHNQAFWAQQEAARFYASRSELYPPERSILQRICPDCRGRPILDLGVGTGRTTAALLAISSDYLGIDYSAAMVERCRNRFAGVAFQQADVRDLSRLRDRRFALIIFSFNGLDYITHDERLETMRALHALLADDGWFVFSSHNRLRRVPPPWDLRQLTRGPISRLGGRLWAFGRGIAAYHANRHGAYEGVDHAQRIDSAFNYKLLTYYISPTDQLAQLRAVGFVPVDIYTMDGPAAAAPDSLQDPWLYYLARK